MAVETRREGKQFFEKILGINRFLQISHECTCLPADKVNEAKDAILSQFENVIVYVTESKAGVKDSVWTGLQSNIWKNCLNSLFAMNEAMGYCRLRLNYEKWGDRHEDHTGDAVYHNERSACQDQ